MEPDQCDQDHQRSGNPACYLDWSKKSRDSGKSVTALLLDQLNKLADRFSIVGHKECEISDDD